MLHKELFPVIECAGTPYEIGLAHGKGAAPQIRATVDTYKAMFWDYSRRYAKTFIGTIGEYDADLMEEICGVADGSGYEREDILALNVRSEIVLQGAQVPQADGGCTSFAFLPRVTEAGCTWLG